MSFLNQLKSQAQDLQNQQARQHLSHEESTAQTESACKAAWKYLQELAHQLNVIAPAGPRLSLDGKAYWPTMRLVDFRVDARRKMLRNKEVFDCLAMGWRIVPLQGQPQAASVQVNFPPDLERVQQRLGYGAIRHERKEIRHPEKNSLLAYCFEFMTESRGGVLITPDHDKGELAFRLTNLNGFELLHSLWPARQAGHELMDELAKLIMRQPSHFIPVARAHVN